MSGMFMCQRMVPVSATNSAFPEAERWLEDDEQVRHAIQWITQGAEKKGYRHMFDFLTCLFHPECVQSCKRFYAGSGLGLVELFDESDIVVLEAEIMIALALACTLCDRQMKPKSLEHFRLQVQALTISLGVIA